MVSWPPTPPNTVGRVSRACATTISFVRFLQPAGRFVKRAFLFSSVMLCGAPTVDLIIGRHFFPLLRLLSPFFPLAKVCEDDLSFIMQMRDTWRTKERTIWRKFFR